MSLPLILTRRAQRDAIEAAEWLERNSGSSEQFDNDVDRVLEQIASMPELHAVVFADIRRARVARTAYNLYYRILSNRITVLAIVHGSRDPSVWRSRL